MKVINLMQSNTFSLIIPMKKEIFDMNELKPYFDLVQEVVIPYTDINSSILALSKDPKVRIIPQKSYIGKGSAILLALLKVREKYSILLDADLPISAHELKQHINLINENTNLDLLKGSRHLIGGGSSDFTPFRKFGAKLFAKLTNIVFKTSWSEVCYGFWILKNENIRHLQINELLSKKTKVYPFNRIPYSHSFELDQVIMLRLLKSNRTIIEVPSYEYARVFGESNLNVIRDGLKTFCVILNEKFFDTQKVK